MSYLMMIFLALVVLIVIMVCVWMSPFGSQNQTQLDETNNTNPRRQQNPRTQTQKTSPKEQSEHHNRNAYLRFIRDTLKGRLSELLLELNIEEKPGTERYVEKLSNAANPHEDHRKALDAIINSCRKFDAIIAEETKRRPSPNGTSQNLRLILKTPNNHKKSHALEAQTKPHELEKDRLVTLSKRSHKDHGA